MTSAAQPHTHSPSSSSFSGRRQEEEQHWSLVHAEETVNFVALTGQTGAFNAQELQQTFVYYQQHPDGTRSACTAERVSELLARNDDQLAKKDHQIARLSYDLNRMEIDLRWSKFCSTPKKNSLFHKVGRSYCCS